VKSMEKAPDGLGQNCWCKTVEYLRLCQEAFGLDIESKSAEEALPVLYTRPTMSDLFDSCCTQSDQLKCE
jgi:hypothetical protein